MNAPKILYLVTEDWFFCSHFLERAKAARHAGYEVTVVARTREHAAAITGHGLRLIPINLERRGKNVLREFRLIRELITVYKAEKPSIVHQIALKPIIYGTIAAKVAKVPHIINAPVGMGYVFSSDHLKAKLARPLVMSLFSFLLQPDNGRVILENSDDIAMLADRRLLDETRTVLIRGAGVDVTRFAPKPEPEGPLTVILPARMLWDKGVGEFVEAARRIRIQGISCQFALVGAPDAENPAAVPKAQLAAWQSEGVIVWLGHQDNMPEVYARAHIICLPSYREGLPKTLIEAAASGRAVVATDAPGCREVVRDGYNGFLVPVRDATALTEALLRLIQEPELRARMGERGRQIAVEEFSQDQVNDETLAVYRDMLR